MTDERETTTTDERGTTTDERETTTTDERGATTMAPRGATTTAPCPWLVQAPAADGRRRRRTAIPRATPSAKRLIDSPSSCPGEAQRVLPPQHLLWPLLR